MTGATIRLDDAAVLAALGGVAEATDDFAPVLKAIGEILQRSTKDRIEAETDPEGSPWPALNPIYAETKKGPGMLRESNQLFGTIVYEAARDTLDVGTNRPHARVHQFGARIVPKNASALVFEMGGKTFRLASVTIPARRFLGISEGDRVAILDTVADYLDLASGGALTAAPTL